MWDPSAFNRQETSHAAWLLHRPIERSTMMSMKRLHGDSWINWPTLRSAFKRFERIAASVLLAVGAAALLGWIVVELYVKAVTAD
jgi:hypothetical protein